MLARAEGNLFVVALGGPVSTTRALLVAERLRAAIEGHAWDGVHAGLRVTASIGVAARAPGHSLDDAPARRRRGAAEEGPARPVPSCPVPAGKPADATAAPAAR